MIITRTPARLLLAAGVALAPVMAGAQQQGTGAPEHDVAPPDAPVPPEGARSATDVELFDFVGGVTGATGEILEAEAEADRAVREELVYVGDLTGRAVLGEQDETVGEIERVVRWDDSTLAVIKKGGLLGIGGDRLPVELDRLTVTPDYELRVPGLTEENVEAAGDVDLDSAEDLPPGMPLTELRP